MIGDNLSLQLCYGCGQHDCVTHTNPETAGPQGNVDIKRQTGMGMSLSGVRSPQPGEPGKHCPGPADFMCPDEHHCHQPQEPAYHPAGMSLAWCAAVGSFTVTHGVVMQQQQQHICADSVLLDVHAVSAGMKGAQF